MILMIDNYDSFTFNLVQYIEQIGYPVKVIRNDAATIEEIDAWDPAGIVISPGPGRPEKAGISIPLIRAFLRQSADSGGLPRTSSHCGHLWRSSGCRPAPHARQNLFDQIGWRKALYQGINKPFKAMRYHSLAVARQSLPDCLKITAEADDGEIMGIRHVSHPTEGIQFHPESIMTTVGKRLLRNFLQQTANEIKMTA